MPTIHQRPRTTLEVRTKPQPRNAPKVPRALRSVRNLTVQEMNEEAVRLIADAIRTGRYLYLAGYDDDPRPQSENNTDDEMVCRFCVCVEARPGEAFRAAWTDPAQTGEREPEPPAVTEEALAQARENAAIFRAETREQIARDVDATVMNDATRLRTAYRRLYALEILLCNMLNAEDDADAAAGNKSKRNDAQQRATSLYREIAARLKREDAGADGKPGRYKPSDFVEVRIVDGKKQ